MGAKCKTFSAVRKQAEAQAPQQPLTTDQKLENMAANMSTALNDHAAILNAVAYYIESTDTKVAKAGGLLKWVEKDVNKKQRLRERQAAYQASKNK